MNILANSDGASALLVLGGMITLGGIWALISSPSCPERSWEIMQRTWGKIFPRMTRESVYLLQGGTMVCIGVVLMFLGLVISLLRWVLS